MWVKGDDSTTPVQDNFDATNEEIHPLYDTEKDDSAFPSLEEFKENVRFLPNWRAPGPEEVYNFFIKGL